MTGGFVPRWSEKRVSLTLLLTHYWVVSEQRKYTTNIGEANLSLSEWLTLCNSIFITKVSKYNESLQVLCSNESIYFYMEFKLSEKPSRILLWSIEVLKRKVKELEFKPNSFTWYCFLLDIRWSSGSGLILSLKGQTTVAFGKVAYLNLSKI